ncbi:MAG TPA: hypothetical protein PLJ04_00910 [Candidatus Saccharibacteria bacterium]|nr:hypothetical protein [Candidatus Saccharibacteria bacterium]MCB9817228.1 hypothetical protein [Candidatus Nomurabacteria bacterium]HPR10117.1 hypothetical protein [Candidatus Saccharibacteria bacterium]
MAKTKNKQKTPIEPDSVYFLKLVLYFLLGCLWIQVGGSNGISIPVGLVIGIVFASHDNFQIDRKIEIAVLLIATVLSFIAPIGFVLTVGS